MKCNSVQLNKDTLYLGNNNIVYLLKYFTH